MKKILLSLVVVFAIGANSKLNAQCDLAFSNLVITNADGAVNIGPGKCQYLFNASFDITTNSGFKYLFFHSWLKDDYPNPAIFDCSGNQSSTNPGTSAQLGTALDQPGKSFMDIGFINLNSITFQTGVPVDVTSNIATTYPHDATVELTNPGNSTGMMAYVTRTSSNMLHFDLYNVRFVVNALCGSPIVVKTDIWGSNAASPDPKAQCYLCGLLQSFNDPLIALQKICTASPYQYEVGLTTQQTTPFNVQYKVYMDDLDQVQEPGADDPLIYTSPVISISASTPYSSGLVTLPNPYCCVDPWSQWGIYVRVTSPYAFGNTISTPVIEAACGTLPIKLKSFNAARNKSVVQLSWETSTETNNKGFEIQRLIGNGGWQTIGFVATKASGGNSSASINYEYFDNNTTQGVIQYRLKQVDIDGRYAFSPIRSVRGEAQNNQTIIYPNPSSDGKINILFENVNGIRDVSVMDVNGRMIKQFKRISNNNIQIENLNAGFYTVRIVDIQTGEQVVEKFVVNKR